MSATIDSHKLYAWCDAVQKSISNARARLLRELIDERFERYNRKRWWRPFKRLVTLDAVTTEVERESARGLTSAWTALHHASGQYDIAEKLKAACLFSERIVVSTEDLEKLHYWSEDIARSIFKPGELR